MSKKPNGQKISSKIRITQLGGNCPVQADGFVGSQPFYFRSRGSSWRLNIGGATGADLVSSPNWSYREDYGEWPEAGWITEEQAVEFIEKAVAKWRIDQGMS